MATVATQWRVGLPSARAMAMNQTTGGTRTRPMAGIAGMACSMAASTTKAEPGTPCAPVLARACPCLPVLARARPCEPVLVPVRDREDRQQVGRRDRRVGGLRDESRRQREPPAVGRQAARSGTLPAPGRGAWSRGRRLLVCKKCRQKQARAFGGFTLRIARAHVSTDATAAAVSRPGASWAACAAGHRTTRTTNSPGARGARRVTMPGRGGALQFGKSKATAYGAAGRCVIEDQAPSRRSIAPRSQVTPI